MTGSIPATRSLPRDAGHRHLESTHGESPLCASASRHSVLHHECVVGLHMCGVLCWVRACKGVSAGQLMIS